MKHKRSAIVLIFNDKRECALQKRAAHDTSYPSHWDFAAAGGIDMGESPNDAAVRELREELGIDAKPVYIGDYVYRDEKAEDKLSVYRLVHSGPFSPDPNEVEEVHFFSLQAIEDMLQAEEKFHPEFPFLWKIDVIK